MKFKGITVENLKENYEELLFPTTYNLSILENKKHLYHNITFKECIELDLFCEIFNMDKNLMEKY